MNANSISTTRANPGRRLRRRVALLSREGILGAALLLGAAAFTAFMLYPAYQQRTQMQQQLVQLHANQHRNAAKPLPSTPAQQLMEFYQFFPSQSTAPQWLEKIYRAARAHGIQLEQANYTTSKDSHARLLHYQLTLPVKGSYVQLRKFVATVLAAVPIASLDNISFERQKIGDQRIDARIKLTLYLDQQT